MRIQNLQRNRQAGVTLLLSILILAAISAIAFSLATILFVELRSSGDLVRTEPALFATQGVLEEAIFKIKRTVSDSQLPVSDSTPNDSCATQVVLGCILNNVTVTTSVSPYQDNPFSDLVLTSSNTYLNTKNSYYLINPSDPYSDADGNGSPDGGYTSITITNEGVTDINGNSQANLEVALCRIDNNGCVDDVTGTFTPDTNDIGPDTLFPGDQVVYSATDNLVPESAYALYVLNASPQNDPKNGYVKVSTQPVGLPYFGKKAVYVTANYSGLTRKYKAIVPEGGSVGVGSAPTKLTPVAVSASSEVAGNEAAKAADGNLGTFWSAGSLPTQWIQLDLGQPRSITQLHFSPAQLPAGNTIHQIFAGPTVGSMVLIYTFSQFTQGSVWIQHDFSPAVANIRYIKINTTSSPSWVAWEELEVYGN